MTRFHRLLGLCLVGSIALASWGCGGGTGLSSDPTEAREQSALNELGEAYRMYQLTKNAPPKKLADLANIQIAAGGNGLAAVKTGDILVNWGAKLPSTGEEIGGGSSPEVLAYWKAVPESGGYVLMLDRSVKKLTADEFKAAPKPAGTSTDPGAPAKK